MGDIAGVRSPLSFVRRLSPRPPLFRRKDARSPRRGVLELVEPGEQVGDSVVDVGEHALVVVVGERDVL
jgi:hypothetical protein